MLGFDKVGVVLDERLVNVDKGRRGRNAFGDGETEPMRLIGPMIGICRKKRDNEPMEPRKSWLTLTNDHYFDIGGWRIV
jgi:hypothetical protein